MRANTRTTIRFVSLGPGDPELITLQGLKALQKADLIYCPATRRQGILLSRAMEIIQALGIEQGIIQPFILPMSKDRTEAWTAYDQLCAEVKADYLDGRRVVIAAEGDIGFYASVSYIYERLEADGLPVRRIAGIPAFIAAGSWAGVPIVQQEESLQVIPGTATLDALSALIERRTVVVLMKLPSCREAIHACVRRYAGLASFHYFENVGSEGEFHTSDPTAILGREFPYFSLLIIRPRPGHDQ